MLMTMLENKVVTPHHNKTTKSKNRYPPPQVTVLPSHGGFIREGDITDVSVCCNCYVHVPMCRRRRSYDMHLSQLSSSILILIYHYFYIIE